MPIYEYECDGCGHRFERHQSIASEPVKRCPRCGGAVRRVIYPVGIIFKGSGFYVTDHPRPGKPGLASTGPGHQGRRPAPTSERDKGPAEEESKESKTSRIAEEDSEG
ncbi:MAG: FmdB family zinc ribbon protein [Anaerolineae bacterium]